MNRRFTDSGVRTLLKIGSGKFDLPNREKLGLHHFYDQLDHLALEEISLFLEHQHQGNVHEHILYEILKENLRLPRNLPVDKQTEIQNWLLNKWPFSYGIGREVHILFRELDQLNQNKLEDWEAKVISYITNRYPDQSLAILEYGKSIIEQGLSLHNVDCQNGPQCGYQVTCENQIDIVDRLENKVRRQEEQASEVKTGNSGLPAGTLERMEWMGTQKQLAELFVVLQKQGWISKINPKTVVSTFTKTNSIRQYLKPGHDPTTKKPTYEQLYGERYNHMFDNIRENPLV